VPGQAKVLSSAANGIIEFISTSGSDPERVLNTAGISEMDICHDRKMLDLHSYCELLEIAAKDSHDSNFGLRYGRNFTPSRLGLIGDIAIHSPNLSHSLGNLARYFPYHQQNTYTAFRQNDGYCHLEYRILDGFILQRRQDAELTIGMYLNVVRRCLGNRWSPEEVHFEHPKPEYWHEHESVFNAPVYFNMKTNALVFREDDLQRPMPGWTPGQVRERCDALMALTSSTGRLSLSQQVAGEIRALLPDGYPHIEQVADTLRMTRWTLQRRLADETHVFSDLVEKVRQRLAQLYLGEAHLPINDIAGILGYSELSAFSRACARWFEAPPSKVRTLLLESSSQAPATETWPFQAAAAN
jgi:AraC-like DNA-binding protein